MTAPKIPQNSARFPPCLQKSGNHFGVSPPLNASNGLAFFPHCSGGEEKAFSTLIESRELWAYFYVSFPL
jgi:hypothetical protein